MIGKKSLLVFKILIVVTFSVWFALRFWPIETDQKPYSAVLMDKKGNLLGASIAEDGQWRFPNAVSITPALQATILTYEDQYFHFHPGINPVAVVRAIKQNYQSKRVVSGASTLTMQLARMHFNQPRSYWQKFREILTALAFEARYSKNEILMKYVSNAPYGGNVVGIEAASWRYFGRPLDQLSWAENALLAVLPNQPSALYPGKSTEALKIKRDNLLIKLNQKKAIDASELNLAMDEPLPNKPFDIPTQNIHLLHTLKKKAGYQLFNSTIDPFWQSQTQSITDRYQHLFKQNGIENIAALVVDLSDNTILSYIGNTSDVHADGQHVDVIQKPRSSGSLLKPFLMAGALDKGLISPLTLLPDIPTFFSGFTPKNFNHQYAGAIAVNDALARSLNIPFVHLLKQYNYEQFQIELAQSGFTTIDEQSDRYGLSLVLGGAEVTLWDLANVYTGWYRLLANMPVDGIRVQEKAATPARSLLSKIAIWHSLDAMTSLVRPGLDKNWELFDSSQKVAWKTGTSIGFRDGWAVGMNGTVLAAVWVGNADGEGRAALVGSSTAGVVLLELLNLSDHDPEWLENLRPIGTLQEICRASGSLAGKYCSSTVALNLPEMATRIGICPYHQHYFTDTAGKYRVNSSCYPIYEAKQNTGFVLPPSWGYYYSKYHPDYAGLPPLMPECKEKSNPIAMIYPTPTSKIYIPRSGSGKEKVILQASYQQVQTGTLYWHLDDQYLGATQVQHEMTLWLGKGQYALMIADGHGNSLAQAVEVISD